MYSTKIFIKDLTISTPKYFEVTIPPMPLIQCFVQLRESLLEVCNYRLQVWVINQMQKNQPLLPASRNFFSLNRLKPNCYYPPVRVDFSNPNIRSLPTPSILPAYNHDHQFFTPAFLLPADKTYYESNSDLQRNKFTQKMQAEGSPPSGVCQAAMVTEFQVKEGDISYCQVCKLRFQDYWKHVAEQSHARSIHLSPSTAHIRELCGEFAAQKGCQVEENKLQPQKPRRRARKDREMMGGLDRCLSYDMLKTLQGNCSTQILASENAIGQL